MNLSGRQILYESTNHAWAYGWTFYQMLAQALAAGNDIVYLDTPLSLARGGGRYVGGRAEQAEPPSLRLLRTAGLPAQRTERLRGAAARLTAAQASRWARREGFRPDLVWTYVPQALPLLDRFPDAASVYWTGDEVVLAGERALLERVGAILCVSEPVYARHSERYGERAHFTPVACDFERYHAARGSGESELAGLARPIVGYCGFVNRRVDVGLLIALAARLGEGTVVVAGPAGEEEQRALAGTENVALLGPQPADRVPALIDAFDVSLVPYRDTEFNRSSNPVKFYEYLALGKPVVSTDIPTLRRFAPVASVGPAGTFVERVLAALVSAPGTVEERVEVARAHSFGALLSRLRALPL